MPFPLLQVAGAQSHRHPESDSGSVDWRRFHAGPGRIFGLSSGCIAHRVSDFGQRRVRPVYQFIPLEIDPGTVEIQRIAL
jgi:hypothetical protein